MFEYSIFTMCTKNYRGAYEFCIASWLRTAAKYIYIYTDDESWKSNNDRIKIIKLFDESNDWLVNVGRKYMIAKDVVRFGDKLLMFADIDCYFINDIGYIFDKYDFDFAVTRLYKMNTEVSSGLYLFYNTRHNRKFIDDWETDQKRNFKMGIGVKPHAGSYSQLGFSNTLRRYDTQGTHKVIDLDMERYQRKSGKPHQKHNIIEDIKQNKIEVLHFYAKTWGSEGAFEIISYLGV